MNQIEKEYRVLKVTKANHLSEENIKFILVTALSESELMGKYGKEIKAYIPYILRTPDEQFKYDCKRVNLEREYPQWQANEKWAIYTPYLQSELEKLYPDRIKHYQPYLLLSKEQYEAIREYQQNENKYRVRKQMMESNFDMELFIENRKKNMIQIQEFLENREIINCFQQYLKQFPEWKKRRVEKYIFEKETISAIAEEEGISSASAWESIVRLLNHFKRYYHENFE